MFEKGSIEGVIIRPLKKYLDDRGWLAELFRHDELTEEVFPVMSYVSQTLPNIARGPHEHVEQTDFFAFIGPSNFKLYLWDNREKSPTWHKRMTIFLGEDNPASIIIPPGVVHAYRNVGDKPGWVFNAANRLFAGRNRNEMVDEIRHEDRIDSPFHLD